MKVWIIVGHDEYSGWVVSVWSDYDLARNALSILRKLVNPVTSYPPRYSISGPKEVDKKS